MIEIKDLNLGYGKHLLLSNLNLSLQPGHIYGLFGKNGAGKSTLLKCISGLVFPADGSCLVNGFATCKRLPSFLQDIFFVPEDVSLPAITPVKFAKGTGHFYPKFNYQQYLDVLTGFDVPLHIAINKLSLGQQKKVAIAFGLAANTSVLIMDEPTNGLDIPSKMQFRKITASALTDDKCILISTHQVRDLENLIDTVLIINKNDVAVALSLDEITSRVKFCTLNRNDASYLYGEEGLEGTKAIVPNTNGDYTRVDIELLFNGVISNNNALTTILK